MPRHLPFTNIGRVKKAVASGSMCAVLNGEFAGEGEIEGGRDRRKER